MVDLDHFCAMQKNPVKHSTVLDDFTLNERSLLVGLSGVGFLAGSVCL